MTTNWKGGNGNWQTAANWTNGAPITPSAFAVINAAGIYTVTVGSGLEYHVGAVSLNAAGATLSVAGILDLTNKLTVTKGTLALSGTIAGGTIVAAGGTINLQDATLDGVTYAGTLDLSTTPTTITVKDGLTLTDVKGTGLGALNLGDSQINFVGDQTVHHGTFKITGGAVNMTGTLTFAGRMKVLYSVTHNVFSAGASIVNQGTFSLGKSAQATTIDFDNSGKLIVNGGSFNTSTFTNESSGGVTLKAGSVLSTTGQIVNSGTMLASNASLTAGVFTNEAGATLRIAAGSNFTGGSNDSSSGVFDNDGTLIANSSIINLYTHNSNFGTLNIRNSTVTINGLIDSSNGDLLINTLAGHNNQLVLNLAIDNTGHTLDIAPKDFTKLTTFNAGIISGGIVTIECPFSGVLSDLTIQGSMNIDGGGLALTNVTFSGPGGTGRATINLESGAITTSTGIDNVNIIAATRSGISTTTIGSSAKILSDGTLDISCQENDGTIVANGKKALFAIENGSTTSFPRHDFSNNGVVEAENGASITIRRSALGEGPISGGIYYIGAHSTLHDGYASSVDARVVLEGAGANVVNFTKDLAAIATDGALILEHGATLTLASTLTIDGSVQLAKGSLTASIVVDSGGTLGGNGNMLGTVANAGTIDAAKGSLLITQAVSGSGQADIETEATLSFGSNVSAGQTVTFKDDTGTLALGYAQGFAGTIAGFTAGDAIDLVNTKVSSVVYHAASDTLSVKFQGKIIATLQLSGDYTGDSFGVASDGNGGTAITLTGVVPGALQRFTEARAAFSSSDMMAAANPTAIIAGWDSSHMLAAAGHA